jgi:hypothetical protein
MTHCSAVNVCRNTHVFRLLSYFTKEIIMISLCPYVRPSQSFLSQVTDFSETCNDHHPSRGNKISVLLSFNNISMKDVLTSEVGQTISSRKNVG